MTNLYRDFRKRELRGGEKLAIAAVLGLLVGIITGTVAAKENAPDPAPAPQIIERTKEITPGPCLVYMNLSEQAFSYSAEAVSYLTNALDAAGRGDVVTLNEANQNLQRVSARLNELRPSVNQSKDNCRKTAPGQ